jgi:hypothetical protein
MTLTFYLDAIYQREILRGSFHENEALGEKFLSQHPASGGVFFVRLRKDLMKGSLQRREADNPP